MYTDLLKIRDDRGFRYLRLALGLYLRGLDSTQKQIIGRWPTQLAELAELDRPVRHRGRVGRVLVAAAGLEVQRQLRRRYPRGSTGPAWLDHTATRSCGTWPTCATTACR